MQDKKIVPSGLVNARPFIHIYTNTTQRRSAQETLQAIVRRKRTPQAATCAGVGHNCVDNKLTVETCLATLGRFG